MARGIDIARLSVVLDADTVKYLNDLDKAQKKTKQDLNKMNKMFKNSKKAADKSFKGMAVALTALTTAFSVYKLTNLVTETVKGAVELQKLASIAGITTQEMEALNFTGSVLGVSGERIADSFKEITERMEDASRGSGEAKELLKELNLEVNDFLDLEAPEAFEKLANELDKMTDGDAVFWADKFGDGFFDVYQTSRLMGTSVSKLNKEFSELFGGTPTQLQDDLIDLNKTIVTIDTIWNQFQKSFVGAVANPINDALQDIIQSLTDAGDGNIQLGILKAADSFLEGFESVTNALLGGFEIIAELMANVFNALPDSVKGEVKTIGIDYDAQNKAQEKLVSLQEKLQVLKGETFDEDGNYLSQYGDLQDVQLNKFYDIEDQVKIVKKEIESLGKVKFDFGEISISSSLDTAIDDIEFDSFLQSIEDPKKKKGTTKTPSIAGPTIDEYSKYFLDVQNLRDQFGLDDEANKQEAYTDDLLRLNTFYEDELISHQEFLDSKAALDQKYADQKISTEEMILGTLSSLGVAANKDSSDSAKALFAVQQAAALGLATLNALGAYQETYNNTPGPTPIKVAAGVGAEITAWGKVAGIAAQTIGQFHDGEDEVAATGSYYLNEGERVVQPEANKKLTKFLDSAPDNISDTGNTYITQTISAPSIVDKKGFDELLARSSKEIAGLNMHQTNKRASVSKRSGRA